MVMESHLHPAAGAHRGRFPLATGVWVSGPERFTQGPWEREHSGADVQLSAQTLPHEAPMVRTT